MDAQVPYMTWSCPGIEPTWCFHRLEIISRKALQIVIVFYCSGSNDKKKIWRKLCLVQTQFSSNISHPRLIGFVGVELAEAEGRLHSATWAVEPAKFQSLIKPVDDSQIFLLSLSPPPPAPDTLFFVLLIPLPNSGQNISHYLLIYRHQNLMQKFGAGKNQFVPGSYVKINNDNRTPKT